MLVHRELGFALDEVAALLDGDEDDRIRLVREQVGRVTERIDRLQQVRAALETELEATMSGTRLTQAEKRELFGSTWVENEEEYAAEAEQRWGDTDAWRQSRERTSRYSTEDWTRAKAEGDAIDGRFVALLRAGEPADGEAARAVAEEHRQSITRWYYDCPPEMHAGIGRMFPQRGAPGVPPVEDVRFTKTFEDLAPGLARYVSDAFQANAAARG